MSKVVISTREGLDRASATLISSQQDIQEQSITADVSQKFYLRDQQERYSKAIKAVRAAKVVGGQAIIDGDLL